MCIWEAAAGSNIRLVLASSSVQAEQTTTYTYDVLSRHSQHGQLSSDSSEATQLLSAISAASATRSRPASAKAQMACPSNVYFAHFTSGFKSKKPRLQPE